ncbi:MAG: zinc ribbon domain-containing protein [Ruminococcus sp.]|nr:zinc ribbon domain-containing protein [Ruminococcus sp.]
MSDIFDKIGQTFSDIGESVSEKSKYVAEATKLNAKILQEKSSIGSNYSEIGRYYVEHYADNPDPGISDKVAAVIRSKEQIVEMEAKILALKGYIKCTVCGANVPFDDKFCGKCGAVLDKPAPPAPDEEEITPNVSVVPDDVPDDIIE